MPIQVLNGANLGRLGSRDPEIYGITSYAQLEVLCESAAAHLGVAVKVRQTDSESELLSWLHDAADAGDAVLLNPGAWSHNSIAIADACAALTGPLVEVHISNIFAREDFRRHSYVSAHANGVICGLGVDGYLLGLRWLTAQGGVHPHG